MDQILIRLLAVLFVIFQTLFKSKSDLLLGNLALRHQLSIFQIRKTVLKLTDLDRPFWIALKKVWAKWTNSLVIHLNALSIAIRCENQATIIPYLLIRVCVHLETKYTSPAALSYLVYVGDRD